MAALERLSASSKGIEEIRRGEEENKGKNQLEKET